MKPASSWLKAPGLAKLAMKSAWMRFDNVVDSVETQGDDDGVQAGGRANTSAASATNGRSRSAGDAPAALSTISSLSPLSRLRQYSTLPNSAIGAIEASTNGIAEPGDGEEHQDRLPLGGQQIDLLQGAGDPDDRGQRRETRQKRVSGGAENVSFNSQHPAIEFRWPTGECRRSAGGSAALARRGSSGKARGAARAGGRRGLVDGGAKPHDESCGPAAVCEEQHVRIRQDRLWRARRP